MILNFKTMHGELIGIRHDDIVRVEDCGRKGLCRLVCDSDVAEIIQGSVTSTIDRVNQAYEKLK